MSKLFFVLIPVFMLLEGCSSFTAPRYAINADTNVALKANGKTSLAIGDFVGPSDFVANCRAAGVLSAPDGLTHTAYIKKALEDEIKVAGLNDPASSKTTLTGQVSRLEFSSSRGLTGGTWEIDLKLTSSNGKSLAVAEHYEFDSGFAAITACKQTAEAFFPAVQNIILKVVLSPEFKGLLQ